MKESVNLSAFTEIVVNYACRSGQLRSSCDVLNELHDATAHHLPMLSVFGAARLPLKSGDWDSLKLGKSVFIHGSVSKGLWEEYQSLAHGKFRPVMFLAASSMATYTWTEIRRKFQPIGVDNWLYDLATKHGIRDGLTCPVGGRWAFVFWSRQELSNILTEPIRIVLYAAASFAALRLNQLAEADPTITEQVQLTARELAILRLASMGAQIHETAKALEIGEETVRSHLKKAQNKLGASNRTQAVALALRKSLIP